MNRSKMNGSRSLSDKMILPYSQAFTEALLSYCEQMEEAIRGRKHHDHRRNLLLNFLREGLNLDPVEFELEKKIKVHEIRGRIDAFFRHLIIEVKTDLDRERPDAEVELKKYFESQGNPNDFVGIVTDGLNFEIYIYDNKNIKLIRSFTIDSEDPLSAFQSLDHLFSTAKRVIPTPGCVFRRNPPPDSD